LLPTKAELSSLLASLYDAAGNSSLWSAFLGELGRATQSDQAGILLHNLSDGNHGVSLQWGVEPSAARSYQQYFGARDLWIQKAAPLVHEGWLATSQEICSFEELSRSEFYNDYLRANGIGPHALWGVLENSRSRIVNVGLYRSLRRPYGDKDIELLRFLAPHIVRAFRLHLHLSELKARADNLHHAMDQVAIAIILLGDQGRILHTNHKAGQLLAENDGLKMVQGRLQAERASENSELEHLFVQAQATSRGTGLGPGGAISISRRLRPALHALISPVRNVALDSATPVHAVVFVSDPSQKVRPPAVILRALFGLTPAESRLALLLCDGHTPPQIADLIGVSTNTLKTQLTSIYRKTGTSRQSQLVRLLGSVMPIEPPK
jgi:DNA-binding CsgD family transcriptional regulator/PAS domain-containing protein